MNVSGRAESKEHERSRLDHESEAARVVLGSGCRVALRWHWSSRHRAADHSGTAFSIRGVVCPLCPVHLGIILPEMAKAANDEGLLARVARKGPAGGVPRRL